MHARENKEVLSVAIDAPVSFPSVKQWWLELALSYNWCRENCSFVLKNWAWRFKNLTAVILKFQLLKLFWTNFQVWEGKNVVKTGRIMLGETNPFDSKPGTIRGDFCIEIGRWAGVHLLNFVSDMRDTAEIQLATMFLSEKKEKKVTWSTTQKAVMIGTCPLWQTMQRKTFPCTHNWAFNVMLCHSKRVP